MLFNSVHFYFFALLVIPVYFFLPDRGKRWWLLVSSLYFYAVFRVTFTVILLASVFITYFAARAIDSGKGRIRSVYLAFAVIGNLLLLYFFKYIDFSIRAMNLLLGKAPCDIGFIEPTGMILPLGISFFTLQAIAYAVDVYRGTIPATRSFFDFTLFLSFFPQLVAGPIMRAKDLIYQFQEKHSFQIGNLKTGLLLIAGGIFKKTFVADRAGEVVDVIFQNPDSYDWISMWIAVFLHTLQIYGDFSGYSDIAIGIGKIMGYDIPLNFNRPLLAESITDIWRRWHISLSTWLRDYIYIPVGGSRVSLPRSYVNLGITWAVAGIWHGADWTFILWGLTHALAISGERVLFGRPRIKGAYDSLPGVIKAIYALTIFSFALFFFRAQPTGEFQEGFQVAFFMIGKAFSFAPGKTLLPESSILLVTALLLITEILQERKSALVQWFSGKPVLVYGFSAAVLTVAFVVYSVTVSPQFIYFQF